MPRGKPSVHPDIKKQILERIKEGGVKVQDVAEEHGISPKTIWGWMAKGATTGPSILEYAKLKRENIALKELIGAITLELSHEKKKSPGC